MYEESNSRQHLIDRNSPVPTYQQIADDIAKRIAQMEWHIGDKLPSEMELSKTYNVSRVTLRQAMAQLENDGIIEKFQGKGAFVKDNPRRVVQDLAFPSLDLTNVIPNPILSRVIEEELLPAPSAELRHHFEIYEDTPLIHFIRLHYHEEKPVGLSNIWFPADKVPNMSSSILVNGSISKTLYYTYHFDLTTIDNYIESVKLNAVEASLLNSVYDAPGLKISSKYLLADQTPVEYASTIWLGDYARLHYKVEK